MAAVPQQGLAHRGVYRHRVYPTGGCSATGSTAPGVFRPIAQGGTRTGSTAQGVYRHRFYRMVVYQHRGLMYIYIYIYIYVCICVRHYVCKSQVW